MSWIRLLRGRRYNRPRAVVLSGWSIQLLLLLWLFFLSNNDDGGVTGFPPHHHPVIVRSSTPTPAPTQTRTPVSIIKKARGSIVRMRRMNHDGQHDNNTDDEDTTIQEVQKKKEDGGGGGGKGVDVDADANTSTNTNNNNNNNNNRHLRESSNGNYPLLFHLLPHDGDSPMMMMSRRRLRIIGIASLLATTLLLFGGGGGEIRGGGGGRGRGRGLMPTPSVVMAVELPSSSSSSGDISSTSSSSTSGSSSSSSSSSTSSSSSSNSASSNSPGSSMSRGERYWSIMSTSTTTTHDEDDTNNNINHNNAEKRFQANKALIDYAVGTINTQYYDNTGGWNFTPSDFYKQWRDLQKQSASASESSPATSGGGAKELLSTREGTVQNLKYLVSTLNDPYSKYMTRDELRYELKGSSSGQNGSFLGIGAYVEVLKTKPSSSSSASSISKTDNYYSTASETQQQEELSSPNKNFRRSITKNDNEKKKSSSRQTLLTNTRAANLPVVTAVGPNTPAERAGIVVGDRIVGIGDNKSKNNFLGWTRPDIQKYFLDHGYSGGDQHEYFGIADLTIAKPVYYYTSDSTSTSTSTSTSLLEGEGDNNNNNREIVMGYRSTKVKVKLPTTTPTTVIMEPTSSMRGDSVVQYELLTSSSSLLGDSTTTSIFDTALRRSADAATTDNNKNDINNKDGNDNDKKNKIGYIRLTRFSKLSTQGFLNAISSLEEDGAESYIIDLRNNYGGVLQEASLVASSLLGDPHAVLCYLLNARGGFTPVDVEQYVVDFRYPGYLLSSENKATVLKQVQKEHPNMFHTISVPVPQQQRANGADITGEQQQQQPQPLLEKRLVADNWDPPSSYASIHEQVMKRGIHRISYVNSNSNSDSYSNSISYSSNNENNILLLQQQQQQRKMYQKDIVLLINEGTASSAEFFVAALQDNARCVAVVGTKSFGKGLIQHTFPMPDGGGLKLTIGEFLRPSLQHVTNNVFNAQFFDRDRNTETTTGELLTDTASSNGDGYGSTGNDSSTPMGGIRPDVFCDSKQGIPGKPNADLCVGIALDVLEEERTTRQR